MAPLAFLLDPDGTHRMLAAELRNYDPPFSLEEEDTSPSFEPMEDDGERTDLDEASTPDTKTDRSIPAPPTLTRDPKAAIRALAGAAESSRLPPTTPELRKYKNQRAIISAWINHPDQSAVTEDCRHVLELYAQLTESEFSCKPSTMKPAVSFCNGSWAKR